MKPKHPILILIFVFILAVAAAFWYRYHVLAYQPRRWVDTRLYFGLGPGPDDDAAWDLFLDQEVTPRFPSGLTVFEVYGQWQDKPQARIEHLRTKLLDIDYPDTPNNEARIEAIRAA